MLLEEELTLGVDLRGLGVGTDKVVFLPNGSFIASPVLPGCRRRAAARPDGAGEGVGRAGSQPDRGWSKPGRRCRRQAVRWLRSTQWSAGRRRPSRTCTGSEWAPRSLLLDPD
ncbi:hypothetical protein SHJG_p1028 (plasmid) [Streptomyces hygroscopicus subsp. jinggangensis 5008]|nr:hypothetical protein SHJG_p1028 [Streptomyces hygroscopicus subsp. jinggangensis 5008]AGF68313.1 hypothetical protein SHJGH_p1028 [Streptomyces hygroscopicus subsp. jinggangensis TL01]